MTRSIRIGPASALGVVLALTLLCPSAHAAGDVTVRLELSQEFYYEGDVLDVRMSIQNRGDAKIENPIKAPLFDGFVVRQSGATLDRTGTASTEEPARPGKLARDSFYGAVVNLVDLYPQLSRSGVYEIYWSADGLLSDMLVVTVIPRYDPEKKYAAEIVTGQGSIVMDLYGEQSPIAVKSFVDMTHTGYYDNSTFSEIRVDNFVVAGDPRFASTPRQPMQFPAEQSALPLVAGTVVLRPLRPNPPANGPTFAILLRPQPSWTGQVTVLGQVVQGLDVIQRISRQPSTMRNSEPNFKPLSEIGIVSVTIREKQSGAAR